MLAIDNAGTVELAITNLKGCPNIDETGVISTTAISAAADNTSVIYSTTARTGVPYRVVGFIDITEAAAGTWATAPTTVQGVGGQALSAFASLGYGQVWQTVSRTSGPTYYNTTGRAISVSIGFVTDDTLKSMLTIVVDGSTVASVAAQYTYSSYGINAVVPPGSSYVLTGHSTALELR